MHIRMLFAATALSVIGTSAAIAAATGPVAAPAAIAVSDAAGDRRAPANATPHRRTRGEAKQEVLDARANGTLPGPGDKLGYPYNRPAATALRPTLRRHGAGKSPAETAPSLR